ncbi:ATP-binding protein [Saccharopolyspora sp. K220]|uniref:ATP-binding protein n=1 Tax=Saccharopolyspora soli TaxID=2926618 RepID=UPI001F5A9266|nr:ATP-binding protein [Saccharopolyspora soli]MCI2423963.1 ATP-binding protein [Saccharopolyspora soli]
MMPHENHALGEVIRFPHRDTDPTDGQAVVRAVAERIDHDQHETTDGHDDQSAELAGQPRRGIPPALAGKAKHAAEVALPVGKQAVKFTARHLYYLGGGAFDTFSAIYGRWTGRDIDEQIRAAQAAGEHGTVAALQQQRTENKRLFLERIQVWGKFLVKLPVILGGLAVLVLAMTLIVSVVAFFRPDGLSFVDVWDGLFNALAGGFDFAVWAASWAPWAGLAVVAGVLVKGYNTRRRNQSVPAVFAPPVPRSELVNITPHAVVMALRNLGIAELRKWIDEADESQRAGLLGPVTRYGPGVQVEVTLPHGSVTWADVSARRDKLAGNLDRGQHEVHIERDASSEREFTLWVAHSGALDQPVPPSPLLEEGFGPVDIYRDLMPWGVSLKGDPVELNLLQQHFLLAGLSKQGKTAAARALALWAALDPSVRFRIADLKGFGDWSMFAGLAEELIEGAGNENFIATCVMLEWAVGEMERRYEKWRAMGRKGDVDRESSQPGSGFEPLIIIVDEVQKLFTCTTEHPEGGDIGGTGKKSRAVRAAQALHDQARAVNIHFWEFAQNPTNANLPVVVREGAMIRASLPVGTESIAKMALGEAPVDTGAAPHALRVGKDRGVVVLAPGESMDLPGGATHTTVRTHFISTEQGYAITERAKSFRAGVAHQVTEPEQRDLLDDVVAAFPDGEERVKVRDLAALLRELAPTYQPYKKLNGADLAKLLDANGVPVKPHNGFPSVRLQHVTESVAVRAVSDQH